jgi:hypothetical protein
MLLAVVEALVVVVTSWLLVVVKVVDGSTEGVDVATLVVSDKVDTVVVSGTLEVASVVVDVAVASILVI